MLGIICKFNKIVLFVFGEISWRWLYSVDSEITEIIITVVFTDVLHSLFEFAEIASVQIDMLDILKIQGSVL